MNKNIIVALIIGAIFAAICIPILFRGNQRVSKSEKELIRSDQRLEILKERYIEVLRKRKKDEAKMDSIKIALKSHQKTVSKKEIIYEKELSSILSLSADSTFKLLDANIKRADTLR